MKTVLVHDWLTTEGGSEKVLRSVYDLFPSPIYCLLNTLRGSFFDGKEIHTSFIQKMPFASRFYRNYLPLFPLAIEQFDLSHYDVILSSSHAVAKGVLSHADQLHICYCHTPMRYAWDLYHEYVKEAGWVAKLFLHYLRNWDVSSSSRVDEFIANSHFVARRILKLYGKKASVIYPPVDISFFEPSPKKEDFYLVAGRLVHYKRVDLIVKAFQKIDRKLVVVGDGPEMGEIKKFANANVEFVGRISDVELKKYLQKAKAFIFAALEDFGILPVEAQVAGTPVIAFGKGGAVETVVDGVTGVLFDRQEEDSLLGAIKNFEEREFDTDLIRNNAKRFSSERFKQEMKNLVEKKYEDYCAGRRKGK